MRCCPGQFPLDSHDCYFLLTSCKIINAIDDNHHKKTQNLFSSYLCFSH